MKDKYWSCYLNKSNSDIKMLIFTNENFQNLWDEFGGDGECLYLGYSIVNAITAIKSYIKESVTLSLIVIQNRTLFEKRNEYLKKLLRNPVPLDNDFDSAKYFDLLFLAPLIIIKIILLILKR